MKKILLLVVSVMLCGAVVFASPKSHAEMSKKGNKVSANFSTVGGGGKLDKLFAEAMKSGRSNRKTKTGMAILKNMITSEKKEINLKENFENTKKAVEMASKYGVAIALYPEVGVLFSF